MDVSAVGERLRFVIHRIGERLWVKPLLFCLLSVGGAFVAKLADGTDLGDRVPDVTAESIEALLSVMSAGMLVIATLAVASMVAAYDSASRSASPRAFRLIVADDLSQNALSAFMGAFIFSLVGLIALKNDYFDTAGRFALFVMTLLVFAVVIVTFVRWVDGIARLGRMGETIARVERATITALDRRRVAPHLGGAPAPDDAPTGRAVHAAEPGFVQRVDVEALQECAAAAGARVRVTALPGTFAAPDRPLALVRCERGEPGEELLDAVRTRFVVGPERVFDEDPRFGLVVLGEIASRALSPAVNDPGTAIAVLGSMVRVFTRLAEPAPSDAEPDRVWERVEVPGLAMADLFEDAFTSLARDGAGLREVAIRLQKSLAALAALEHGEIRACAEHHSQQALARAERVLEHPADVDAVRAAAL